MIDENRIREDALDLMMAAGYPECEARAAIDLACNTDGVIFEDARVLAGAAILRISLIEIKGDDDGDA